MALTTPASCPRPNARSCTVSTMLYSDGSSGRITIVFRAPGMLLRVRCRLHERRPHVSTDETQGTREEDESADPEHIRLPGPWARMPRADCNPHTMEEPRRRRYGARSSATLGRDSDRARLH